LLDYASPGLLEMIASKGEEMVRDAGSGLVVQEVMLHTIGGEFPGHEEKWPRANKQINQRQSTP